ncbi:hypothetical protein M0805_001353 [Coniferiporia weirii]|nr:hypothetical protein M0805_001353 [Coniferiporia weirii]
MDVDVAHELISYFALRADEFAWNGDACDQVRARRAAMSGVLFFDILLQLGGIGDPQDLYPPADIRALKRLLDTIEHASYDSMKRDCLVYYLLKWQMDGREVGYADEKVISPHYAALADAYWLLDTGLNLDGVLTKFSDARIVKDYTTKIMETLALHPDSSPLIRKFVRTCNPALREPEDLERYLIATAEFSFVEAWQYQRRFPDDSSVRKDLIHKLLLWTLAPKPKPQPLTQLLSVPFSKYEESTVQDFAMHPPEELPAASKAIVREMVSVRLIQSCKYVTAVKFDRQYFSTGTSARGTWGAERERIMKEVLSVMPVVERGLLEAELEALGERARLRTSSTENSWSNLGASGSTDLGASWEDIGRRTSGASRASMGGRPLSSRVPRTSLPNGTAAKSPLFTPGASTSTSHHPQPLSAHPTLVSQTGTTSLFSSIASQPPSARLPTQRSAGVANPKIVVNNLNGSANGTPKVNAFMSRNAFFEPPEPRSPSPEVFPINGSTNLSQSKRMQSRPGTRLPTPPQDEPGLRMQENDGVHEEDIANSVGEHVDGDDSSIASEREDLGFSLFGSATSASATRLTPPSGTVSPKGKRRSSRLADITIGHDRSQEQSEDERDVRRALRVSVPGAFVSDDEIDLLSPASAAGGGESLPDSRRAPPPTSISAGRGRRSSRKRAASPDESADNIDLRMSIPGTLFEDGEEDDADVSSTHANGHARSRENGRGSEEADELAPLPSQRSRRKVPQTPVGKSMKTRLRASRGDSTEPEDGINPAATGRAVRRSSRLSTTSLSPKAEKIEKKNPRPRKSTRTAGAGATATGKGATKRR